MDLGLQSGPCYQDDGIDVMGLELPPVSFRLSRLDADFHNLCSHFSFINKAFAVSLGLQATFDHRGRAWN